MSPLDRTAAVNRARVALALADAWGHLARTDAGNDPTPAAVLAFAEAATEPQWRDVEALARIGYGPASKATRTATLTVLAQRAVDVDDPFASFTKDTAR